MPYFYQETLAANNFQSYVVHYRAYYKKGDFLKACLSHLLLGFEGKENWVTVAIVSAGHPLTLTFMRL